MTSSKPNASRKIRVSVISDIMCPWCYIASTEIDNAIDRLKLPDDGAVEFELEHKPYILNSSWTEDQWEARKEYGIKKFGEDGWNKAQQMLKSRAEAVGITFTSDSIVCSTLRAHRLLKLAWNKGGSDAQMKLLKVLYQATFEYGENISDIDLLAKYATKVGFVSDTEAVDFLKSDELQADVQRMVTCAQRNGISGVPFTIIDGRWAISGGQSSQMYYEIFDKLAQGKEP